MDVCNALLCSMFDFCLIELSPFIVAVFVSLKNPHLFKEREKNPSGVHFLSYHMRHSSQFTPICIQIAKYSHTCTYLAYMYLCTVCKALKIGLRAWLGSPPVESIQSIRMQFNWVEPIHMHVFSVRNYSCHVAGFFFFNILSVLYILGCSVI